MKLRDPQARWLKAPPQEQHAFTLAEAMVSMTVFVLLMGGIVSAHLFGLRMSKLAESRLKANDSARKAVGTMADEIRKCKSTCVGNVSNGVFVALLDGEPQSGTSLLIYPTTNTSNFIVYFLNASDQTFQRTTSTPGTARLLAQGVTNTVIFQAQDCHRNVLTNSQNNRVIHFDLEFFRRQPELPTAEYYKLETAVTRRVLF